MPGSPLHSSPWAHALAPALLGWIGGTALQLQQQALYDAWVYGLLVLGGAVALGTLVMRRSNLGRRQAAALMLALAVAAVLGFALTGLRATAFAKGALPPALEGRDVLVTGTVASLPQRNEMAVRFRFAVDAATLDGVPVGVPALMDVGWYGGAYASGADAVGGAVLTLALNRLPPEVQAGERWRMTLRLKAPHGARNPFGFDYELYLWEQGVLATGYVRAGPRDAAPVLLGQSGRYPVALARQSVRDAIYSRNLPRQQAGLIAALVVGDQAAIDRADWDVFRATGVAHLMSISGLHITMFAWVAAAAVGWLWRRSGRLCLALPAPTAALWGGVILAVLYSMFAGWGIPAQRTCLMLLTVVALRTSGARWPWPWVWLLAFALVVGFDPWALLQAGFWLSFVAVGVLFATDSGAAHAGSTGAAARFGHILREQWVITVALAPLTLLLFGQVSLVGLAANALAIPWVTFLVTPLAMVGVAVPPLWDAAAWALGLLQGVLQSLATLPWATVSVARVPVWMGALAAIGACLLVARLPWALRCVGLPLVVPVLFWQAPPVPAGEMELIAADIGQGNAVLVRTAGHALLFDAGPRYSAQSDAGHRVLVPLLQALDIKLDTVVLSHRDADHVGGAAAVLAMQPQANLLSSVEPEHPLRQQRPGSRCEAGQRWAWDGVSFEVLHPQPADYGRDAKPNAMSCVLRIQSRDQVVLLAGDIEQAQEQALLAQGATLKANVLLVPHHGSNTSSSAAFLDAVAPDLALVQAGYRNRFGHPTPTVLQRYAERHVLVLNSPRCGAFTWKSWQPDLPASLGCTRTAEVRYWHHHVP